MDYVVMYLINTHFVTGDILDFPFPGEGQQEQLTMISLTRPGSTVRCISIDVNIKCIVG